MNPNWQGAYKLTLIKGVWYYCSRKCVEYEQGLTLNDVDFLSYHEFVDELARYGLTEDKCFTCGRKLPYIAEY